MQRSLRTVQTVAKVIKVFTSIFKYVCLVAGVLSFASAFLILIVPEALIGNYAELYSEFYSIGINDKITLFISCVAASIFAIAAGAVYMFAEKYLKNELIAGTPFTYAGASELKRLAIISLAVSGGVMVLSGIFMGIIALLNPQIMNNSEVVEVSMDLTPGLLMLLLSAIFKHGAALRQELIKSKQELSALENVTDNTEAEDAKYNPSSEHKDFESDSFGEK